MSTNGVRSRFLALLAANGGRVSDQDYAELIEYASTRGFTAGELKALLRPTRYITRSRILRGHGVRPDDVRLDAGAWARAEELAAQHGVTRIFEGLRNAQPTAAPTPVTPTAAPSGGRDLGAFTDWVVETPAATLRFATEAANQQWPALVLSTPEWTDPSPRDVAGAHRDALAKVETVEAAVAAVRAALEAEKAYFAVEDTETSSNNHRHGLADLRRFTFFAEVAKILAGAPLPDGQRAVLGQALGAEKERQLCDREYVMDVGSHTNYWPYWKNYRGVVEKALAQTAPDTDAYRQIKNRLDEIHDTKTVLGFRRAVDEKDAEVTTGQALVQRRLYDEGDGHRVSLARTSYPTAPVYETVTLRDGSAAFRDRDKLYYDRPGREQVPEDAAHAARSQAVPRDELGLRPLRTGEPARSGIPFDWNRDGNIALTPIDIGWWGHCHNEAPLNAMAVDPRRGVDLYRADPAVPADQARKLYSSEDIWDALGALTADHEGGYITRTALRTRDAQVESTKFVGSRNDGGHWIMLEPARPGARRVRVDAEVVELWHKSDPEKRYPDPAARFRRDLPDDEGGFAPNPDWVAADIDDDDEITVDGLGRRMTLTTTFVTFDARGQRYQAKERVKLDPTSDEFVKLADEILRVSGQTGGTLVEHWYNPKKASLYQVMVEVSESGRRELSRTEPTPIAEVRLRQETVYDSVIDIHDFVTKNMGLPFTFDTSSGLAVWNYPVKSIRIDRLGDLARSEDGTEVFYTRYRLRYDTMGGPSGDSRYLIRRDGDGNALRAVAEDPMPDFAFRNERWVCAPCTTARNGMPAYNASALNGGYLVDKAGERVVGDLWHRLGTLIYASLSAGSGDGPVCVIEAADGSLKVYDDPAEFEAVIGASQQQA